jgi:hypothetical protein
MVSAARPRRRLLALLTSAVLSLGSATVAVAPVVAATIHPAVSDYVQVSTSATPPTEAQCYSVGRRCFTPQSIRTSYNLQAPV